MTERRLTRQVLKRLNAIDGCKAIKVHGGVFCESGTPDIVGCYRGRAFWLELKSGPLKYPTPIQERRLAEWRSTNAFAFVIRPNQVEALVTRLTENWAIPQGPFGPLR